MENRYIRLCKLSAARIRDQRFEVVMACEAEAVTGEPCWIWESIGL